MIRILLIAAMTGGSCLATPVPEESITSIRDHLVLVGRTGREIIRPGVLLGQGDLVLTPKIAPIDDQPANYLILLEDGRILAAETLENADDSNFELLRVPENLGTGAIALKFGENEEPAPPFLSASVPLSLLQGEPAQIHLARSPAPKDEKEDENATTVLDLALTRAGHPLFDFDGQLVALTTDYDEESQSISWITLDEAFRDCPEASRLLILPDTDGEAPTPVELARPETPAWLLTVFNANAQPSDGSHAIVVDPSGLLVSKASDLGSQLSVRIGDEEHPAALLATDDATDLALLAVDKDRLEAVAWNDASPAPGTIAHTPVRTTCEPANLTLLHGIVSHTLPAHPMSPPVYWSAEQVTSLGIVLEQSETQPRIVRLLEDSPAGTAGAQVGDVLTSLDGVDLPDRATLRKVLASHEVGDELPVVLKRGGESLEIRTTLGPARLSVPGLGEGKLSTIPSFQSLPSLRRSGFPDTWVHDVPLAPWQMGTPLIDDEGHAFGINIASLGHGRTLALPAAMVREAVARMRANSIHF